jgi:hypothetical protein
MFSIGEVNCSEPEQISSSAYGSTSLISITPT